MKNEMKIKVNTGSFPKKGTKREKVFRLMRKAKTVGDYKAAVYKAFPEDPAALATRVLAAAVVLGYVKLTKR